MELTERAWQVVRAAREEAHRLGDEYIGTDHLLLAILRDNEGAASDILADFDVTYEQVYSQIEGVVSF